MGIGNATALFTPAFTECHHGQILVEHGPWSRIYVRPIRNHASSRVKLEQAPQEHPKWYSMLILQRLTHLSSHCAYKSTLSVASKRFPASTKSYAKMSSPASGTNGESSYKPRFVDVSSDRLLESEFVLIISIVDWYQLDGSGILRRSSRQRTPSIRFRCCSPACKRCRLQRADHHGVRPSEF